MAVGALGLGIGAVRAESQEKLNTLLMDAAKSGDAAQAKHALERGANPNCRVAGTWLNFTPLLEAISENHLEVVKILLEHGADPTLEDDNGDPALVFAAHKKHEEIARLLLKRNISIDAKNSAGLTALTRQITYAPAEDIRAVLDLGADPNQRNALGQTPLMLLAGSHSVSTEKNQEIQSMDVLIEKGADVNARDTRGYTPLMYSVSEGSFDDIQRLIKAGADVNIAGDDGSTSLMLALNRFYEDGRIGYLIEHGANLKATDGDGVTTLMMALASGHLKEATLFVGRGADPKARTKSGRTAAHFAASYSGAYAREASERAAMRRMAVNLLRLVFESGVDLNRADKDGTTPVLIAVQSGSLEAVDFLLNHRCNPNAANGKGETPLIFSVNADHDAFAKSKLLITRGANLDAKNQKGFTALMIAAQTMRRGHFMYFLRKGANVNMVDANGETALGHLAACCENQRVDAADFAAMMRALIGKILSVNERDRHGMTPLMWTAVSNIPDAVNALLEKKPQIDARANDGRTPLMWAVCADAEKTIPLLISSGADLSAKDKSGRTARDWASLLNVRALGMLPAQAGER